MIKAEFNKNESLIMVYDNGLLISEHPNTDFYRRKFGLAGKNLNEFVGGN
jgi:hypothetical protein